MSDITKLQRVGEAMPFSELPIDAIFAFVVQGPFEGVPYFWQKRGPNKVSLPPVYYPSRKDKDIMKWRLNRKPHLVMVYLFKEANG